MRPSTTSETTARAVDEAVRKLLTEAEERAEDVIPSNKAPFDKLLAELTFDHRTTFSELLTEIGAAAQEAGVEVRETNYESDTIEGNERSRFRFDE